MRKLNEFLPSIRNQQREKPETNWILNQTIHFSHEEKLDDILRLASGQNLKREPQRTIDTELAELNKF